MNTTRANLAREANEKAAEIRDAQGYDPRSPLCIYELCDRLGVKVRFVDDISMEGFYRASGAPAIILSSLRPLARRAFTAAHELGHHLFGHGSTIDELKDEAAGGTFDPDEFLVECFAGYLLMPPLGVKRAFASRGLEPATATPEDVYRVACSFGVGYTTLADHLAYALKLITPARAEALGRVKLPQIREHLTGISSKEHLVIADRHHAGPTLDAEVGNLVLLPAGTKADSDQIECVSDVASGTLFRALRPGLVRASVPGSDWALIVRVSRAQYAGLAKYRHLEEIRCYQNYAYMVLQSGVVAYDLTNPASPALQQIGCCPSYAISFLDNTPNQNSLSPSDFEIVGDLMYVGTMSGGRFSASAYQKAIVALWEVNPWVAVRAVLNGEVKGISISFPVTERFYRELASGKGVSYACPPDQIEPCRSQWIVVEGLATTAFEHSRRRRPGPSLVMAMMCQQAYLSDLPGCPQQVPLHLLSFAGTPVGKARLERFGYLPTGNKMGDFDIVFLERIIHLEGTGMADAQLIGVWLGMQKTLRRLYPRPGRCGDEVLVPARSSPAVTS